MIEVKEFGDIITLREEDKLNIVNIKGQEELKDLIERLEQIYIIRHNENILN